MEMDHSEHQHWGENYRKLFVMIGLSFISMYILMYSMVNSISNVYSSFNQVYMAGVMAAPMAIIELLLMRKMYKNKKLNALILAGSLIALIGFFSFIRQQTAISDKQFLRSMIPHHAGAILMCEKSSAQSPVIKELCKNILLSQQAEIEQMKTMLSDLEK